jgi:hypothetical protein
MRSRTLFGALGGLIGLAVGVAVSLGVVAVVAGILWIFVFGDNPWPPGASSALAAIPLILIIVLVIAGTLAGLSYARGLERLLPQERKRKKWIAAISAVFVVALSATTLLLVLRQRSVQTSTTQVQEADFERMVKRAQRIVSISPAIQGEEEALDVKIVTTGEDEGRYHVRLDLSRPGGARLLSREETWVLAPGRNEQTLVIAATEVIDAYRATAFSRGAVGLSLTEEESLAVTLQPLTEGEAAKVLSPSEAQNLRLGASKLTDSKTVPLKVSLIISKTGEASLQLEPN